MKKMLEESFLTIEQMGYGIIDPVLAHWEVDGQKENLTDLTIYGQNSPILFDDIWLEEYYNHLQQTSGGEKEQDKWQDLVTAIDHIIKNEGFWTQEAPLDTDDKAQVEKAIKHRIEQIENYSIKNAFTEFEEWPDKTVDILSWPDPVNQTKSEGVVVELPIKIYSPYGRIVLSGTIKTSSGYGNSSVKNLLTHIPKTVDTQNIKASLIDGELLLELPG